MKIWSSLLILLFIIEFLFSQNHLLISEVQVAPDDPSSQEFIELFNPNSSSINLDNYYLSDYNTYYEVVQGNFPSSNSDFLVKFPNGASIGSGDVLVIALDGSTFNGSADFEVKRRSIVPDMDSLYIGSAASLSNLEMVVLFYWDGVSDLVSDVDYSMWGNYSPAFVDKTGISIDGPDGDGTPSTYADDTPRNNQIPFDPAPISGKSMERETVLEENENFMGGNGINGHDETSETIGENFLLQDNPTPGSTHLTVPSGDGSGVAYVFPDSIKVDSTATFSFVIKGNMQETLTDISLSIPDSWSWTGLLGDVNLDGPAFSSANVSVTDTNITITDAAITVSDSGIVEIDSLISPSEPEHSSFNIKTAVSGGTLTSINNSPVVTVWEPVTITSIADIKANPAGYTTVTIEGIVVVGAGVIATGWTSAYVQDNSGRGINIYQSGIVDPNLVRGHRVRITGTVDIYGGVVEIVDYNLQVISTGNQLPAALVLTTQQANNVSLEGTYIDVSGEVTDFATGVGGGTNIRIDDGSGECLIRVWDTAGLNLSGVELGVQLGVMGPMGIYQPDTSIIPQILLAYQEDLFIVETQPGDGSGIATVTPDSVDRGQSNISLSFNLVGESYYILETVSLTIPSDWEWSGLVADVQVSGLGFIGSSISIEDRTILLTSTSVSASAQGTIVIDQLTSPDEDVFSFFNIRTAVQNGVLTGIANNPRVVVGEGLSVTPISDIKQNLNDYLGQEVSIRAVVVLGAGITTTSRTDAYVQDNSGYGINVFQWEIDSRLVRGREVLITGTVDVYEGIVEIVDYNLETLNENVTLPQPLLLTTYEANDIRWEGVFIQVNGIIEDIYWAGGGTTISVNDGSGPCDLRIWDSADLNLSAFSDGDTLFARGPMDIYQGSGQILIGYQEDIYKPGGGVVGDGTGFAIIEPDTISPGRTNVDLRLSIWGNAEDTLHAVQVILPPNWNWSGSEDDVILSGNGFSDANRNLMLEYGEYYIEIQDASVTQNDTGIVSLTGFNAPNESVYSYFWVKTAVEGGMPDFIEENPYITVGSYPRYLIRDLQINSSQFSESVNIQGVVTVGAGILRTDRTSAYIQDESGYGINISRSGAPDTTYRRGFLIDMVGQVSEYNQTTQINPLLANIVDSVAAIPEPINLTTLEANDPRWDGTLVQVPKNPGRDYAIVTEKYSTSTQAPHDYNIVVNDGSGGLTLRVWGTTGINLDTVQINNAIVANGVGSVYVQDGVPLYQILPAYQSDVQVDPSYVPSIDNVSLEVSPHPFVPDKGEKITIWYNAGSINNQVTIRVFDLAGRLVTTLLDERAELSQNTLEWDGRDHLFDYVGLGTYICHLEVMEPVSGKKKNKMAPIVVGTMLKK